jgi:DNA primase
MKKQFMFERECIHRDRGADGDVYNGMFFVQALQRLQSCDAVKMAGKVSPFYWVDAPRVVVWLCRDCAAELHISDAPRAVLQGARR